MKHLVTGSKGFLGQHLMRALGSDAVGVDLPGCDITTPWDYPGLEWPTILGSKIYGIEIVWHLAAVNDATATFYSDPWRVLHTQIAGTLNVIDACVANGVKTLVLFSSSEVYQTPPVIPTPEDVPLVVPDLKNPRYSYGGGKIAAELLAWHSKIPRVIIIRPHNVYGPGQGKGHAVPDLVSRFLHDPGGIWDVPGAAADSRAFCYVSDFIAACQIVAQQPGDKLRAVYNIGTATETSLHDLFATLVVMTNRRDAVANFTGRPAGATSRRCPDTAAVRSLGWSPVVDLVGGLAKTIAWHREQKK